MHHRPQMGERTDISFDLLASERLRVRNIQARGMARVMDRIRENQRFAQARTAQPRSSFVYSATARYLSAGAAALAAGLTVVIGFELVAPEHAALPVSIPAQSATLTHASAAAGRPTVLEAAVDRAHSGSTLLVPVGTRLETSNAPLRIAKPLTIGTPG